MRRAKGQLRGRRRRKNSSGCAFGALATSRQTLRLGGGGEGSRGKLQLRGEGDTVAVVHPMANQMQLCLLHIGSFHTNVL